MLHSICQQIWKTQQWPQDWKSSVFIPVPKKGNAKECSNYHTVVLIPHASKVMLKFLQARLQQYMNHELPDVQIGFRKGRETRDQIGNFIGSLKKQEGSRKMSTSALLTIQTLWLWGSQQTVENSERDRNTRPPDLPLEKSIMQVRKQQLELDMKQQTISKLGKEYVKAAYCHPAYLTYVQSTSWEMLGWMKSKLESRFPGEISTTSDMQMTPPLWHKVKKN